MMEKKYQLVAWTENVTDNERGRLYMIPSLECEVRAALVADFTFIRKEENKNHGPISIELARRAIQAYEAMSRFKILTGHSGDGIRYLFFAAKYCVIDDYPNLTNQDSDPCSSPSFYREMRDEFVRLCQKGVSLAKKYNRTDILQERTPERMLELYYQYAI